MAIVVGSLAIFTGCQFKGHSGGSPPWAGGAGGTGGTGGTGGGDVWQPVPLGVRVYPSSRFTMIRKQSVFEARLEFSDQMGDPVKAAGVFHLTLYKGSHVGRGLLGTKLYGWDISLLTLKDQQRYYDAVTRTYHLSLKLDEVWNTNDPVTLKVVFVRHDGHRLQTQTTLGGALSEHD